MEDFSAKISQEQWREVQEFMNEYKEDEGKKNLLLQSINDTLEGGLRSANFKVFPAAYVINAQDSLDATYPMYVHFNIISEMIKIVSIKMSFWLLPFRAYSKAGSAQGTPSGGGQTSSSVSTPSGGGSTSGGQGSASGGGATSGSGGGQTSSYVATPSGGGATSGSKTTPSGGGGTSGAKGSASGGGATSGSKTTPSGGGDTSGAGGATTPTSNQESGRYTGTQAAHHNHPYTAPSEYTGIENGDHTHGIPQHTHTVSIPNHYHSTPDHTHPSHTHTTPNHTHPNHTHSTPAHTHPSHTHTTPNHTHPTHAHTVANHYHSTPNHTHPNHYHSTPNHTHPAHDHTVANHTHPNHTHSAVYGIFEEETSPTIMVYISRDNGLTYSLPLGSYTNDQEILDITRFIDKAGSKMIKFTSNARTRLSVQIEIKLDIKAR